MENLFAYRLPYGKLIHSDWDTLSFMHSIGTEVVTMAPMNVSNYAGTPYSDYPLIWEWDETYNFDSLDRQFEDVLRHHPTARLLVVADLNSPPWLSRRLGVDSFACVAETMCLESWRNLTFKWLSAFLAHCESRYGDHILGYIPACGGTLEWYNIYGFAPGIHRTLRYPEFCRRHGWPVRPVPTYDLMLSSAHGFVRDPESESDVIQYCRYIEVAESEFVVEVLQRMRSAIPPTRVLGMFFGYILGMFLNGHSEYQRTFDQCKPDFVVEASCNCDRTLGHTGGYAFAMPGLKARGIGILHEIDRITDTTDLYATHGGGAGWVRWDTPEKAVSGLKREMSLALVEGFSLWWFNIWGMSYRSAPVRRSLSRMSQIWKEHGQSSSGSLAEVLFVFDRESNYYVNTSHVENDWPKRQNVLGHVIRNGFSATQLACDNAEWDDLEAMDLSQYRLIVFQNPTVMTDARKRFLEERVLCDGRTVVWSIAPGVIFNGTYTGVPLSFQPGNYTAVLPDEPEQLTPERLRELALEAGVHDYAPGCASWASREYLMVHYSGAGERRKVTLREPVASVTELFSNRVIPVNGVTFEDEFASEDTHLYWLRSDS